VDGTLAAGSAVSVNGGTLAGTGTANGTVSVANLATLAAGNSTNAIGTFGTGELTLNSGSTTAFQISSLLGTSDRLNVAGNLNITAGALLTLSDLGAVASLAPSYTLVSYTGTWNGGLYTYEGSTLTDGAQIVLGANTYQFNYANNSAVTLTAVPEPSLAGMIGLAGLAAWGFRRRR
jgi:hypothetical protein